MELPPHIQKMVDEATEALSKAHEAVRQHIADNYKCEHEIAHQATHKVLAQTVHEYDQLKEDHRRLQDRANKMADTILDLRNELKAKP